MKPRIQTLVVLLIIALGFMFAPEAMARNIHVLVVADTADESIGRYCEVDVQKIKSLFTYLVPKGKWCFTVLRSSETRYTQASIFTKIRRHGVGRDDAFLFIFTGHGGNANNHHFMALPNGGRLWSYKLDDVVDAKRCNFRAIISSSCNSYVDRASAAAKRPTERWNVERDGIAPVMDELFFNHSGLLHTNSSWPGNYGWTNRNGSWFLSSMFGFMSNTPTARPGWDSVDGMLDRTLDKKFNDLVRRTRNDSNYKFKFPRGQTHAMPIVWDSPRHNPRGSRFGVAGEDLSRGGIRVLSIDRNSSARGVLQRGDVITRINGLRIDDIDDYIDSVGMSSKKMNYQFRRNGKAYSSTAKLAR